MQYDSVVNMAAILNDPSDRQVYLTCSTSNLIQIRFNNSIFFRWTYFLVTGVMHLNVHLYRLCGFL